jgi:hypothetical protein
MHHAAMAPHQSGTSLEMLKLLIQAGAKNAPFLSRFILSSLYQDRLGSNIGEKHSRKEMMRFRAGGDIHAKDNQGAHPTQKAKTLPAKMRTKYGLQRFAASLPKGEL